MTSAEFISDCWFAVKHCCKLRTSRAYREESASVLIVGHTPIQEIACHTTIKTLFLGPQVDQLPGTRDPELKVCFTSVFLRTLLLSMVVTVSPMACIQVFRQHALLESANLF